MLLQLGLGVEQVHLAGPAVLHQHDDGFGPGAKCAGCALQIEVGRRTADSAASNPRRAGCRPAPCAETQARGVRKHLAAGDRPRRSGMTQCFSWHGSLRDIQKLVGVEQHLAQMRQRLCGCFGRRHRPTADTAWCCWRAGRRPSALRPSDGLAAKAITKALARFAVRRHSRSALKPWPRTPRPARRTKSSLSIVSDCETTADGAGACSCGQLGLVEGLQQRKVVAPARQQIQAAAIGSSAAKLLSFFTTTVPSGLPSIGIGGPPIASSSCPLAAEIASRTLSDSSCRSRIRHSNSLPGSTCSGSERPICRRSVRPWCTAGARCLPINARRHDQLHQRLDAPAVRLKFDGQPIEQLGMRGRLPEWPKLSRVATIPWPNRYCQTRLTYTRATSPAGRRVRLGQPARKCQAASAGLRAGLRVAAMPACDGDSASTRKKPAGTSGPG